MEWLELIQLICLPEHNVPIEAHPNTTIDTFDVPMANGVTKDFPDDYEVPITLADTLREGWHCAGYTIAIQPIEQNAPDCLRRVTTDGQTTAFLYGRSAAYDLGFVEQPDLDRFVAFVREHDSEDGKLFTITSVWRVNMEFDYPDVRVAKWTCTLLGALDYTKLDTVLLGVTV